MARLSLSSYWLSGRALSSDWMARISLSSYWLSGRALLCVPADVDPVLQDDLNIFPTYKNIVPIVL